MFFAQKKYSRSVATEVSGPGNISVVLLSMEGQIDLRFNLKHLNLCSKDERWSNGSGTT